MNTLELKVFGNKRMQTELEIDGNTIPIKKNSLGNIDYVYTTESDTAEIRLTKTLELNGPLWFLMSALFYLVSIFGLFDAHYDRKCQQINYRVIVFLTGTNALKIKMRPFALNKKATETVYDGEIEEIENTYCIDTQAKKRRRIVVALRFLPWLALVALLIWYIISLF